MFNIERFEKIFGSSTTTKQSRSTNSTPINRQKRRIRNVGSEPRKRRQPDEFSQFSLNVTISKPQSVSTKAYTTYSPFSRLDEANQSLDSPDKKNILPHLSCQLEDFDNLVENGPEDPVKESLIDESTVKSNEFAKRLDLIDHDAFSPDIEDFSESEDIFKISQSKIILAEVNKEIEGIHKQKPRYKPMKKVAKAGGLMEKLRSMKESRNAKVCSFAKSNEFVEDERKIEILEYSALCRRLLVKFKFVDGPPDLNHHDRHHFFFTSTDFISPFGKQIIYDVVFNQSATREVTTNNFVYFLKMMRASEV